MKGCDKMEKFQKTRELVSTLKLYTRIQVSFLEHLEEHDKDIYALQETVKRLEATTRAQQREIESLRLVLGGKVNV